MVRAFKTHEIRRQFELDNLWSFSPCSGEYSGKTYKVAVPSSWETYPEFTSYRGQALYSTPVKAGGNLRLVFKGVSHTADVTFDGKKIAHHYNAFTPFAAVVKNASDTLHQLEVKVDNSFSEASALHVPNDYMTYGGITRPVVVQVIPDVYIEYVHFTPCLKDGVWTAAISACVKSIADEDKSIALKASLNGVEYDLGEAAILPGAEVIVNQTVAFDGVQAYMPEAPNLYLLKTHLYCDGEPNACDDLIERVGFREVKLEGRKILFNGKALCIKGFCRHEDHPMFGCALPYQAIDYDLNLIKDLGANSIRTSHYPNDELFLDLCDEKGILIWEEGHARGLTEEDMRNPNFNRQSADCIQEMIQNHYNHPSIYIWGVMNECASETEYGKTCYEKQISQIKSLDTSRPTSFASCKFKTDLCFGIPDVVSYNIYPGWYHDAPVADYLADLYQWVQDSTEGSGKPFLVTEIGAGGIYGYRSPTNVKWTEERQAETLRTQINAVLNQEGVSGIYIWQFCDVRVCEEWFSNRPRTMNNKGVVDEYRRRKLAYNVVKELYTAAPNYR